MADAGSAPGPCAGLTVVELAVGTSDLGLGLAGGVPGMLLADLGASVTRVIGTSAPAIDGSVTWGRAWHRDKRIVATDDAEDARALLAAADVVLAYGPEPLVEGRGLGYLDLVRTEPELVYARCRPSTTAAGAVDDYGLLVEARAGFCSQLDGHRRGPIFVDVRASGAGAALVLTASVFALLHRRAADGRGGWAETSLYDGMLSTLGCMIGRPERGPADVTHYWEHGSTFPNFLYRCADGELLQVWFGGKGMYPKLLEVLGDEPSEQGYYTDQATGALRERKERWRAFFAREPRDVWIARLRAAGIACEPVLTPGDALREPHLAEIGLAVARTDRGHDDVVVGAPITVRPLDARAAPARAWSRPDTGAALLDGVRVLDFSAFVAGPLAAEVLADLGADVIKVEPPGGEAMRAAAYAVAACQRGKRSLALDVNAPEARPVVERLVRWADVVLHNFRVGVAERLGIDDASVARLNPHAVYCHASAFGETGPRAKAPGNDALMQALTGFEHAVGGEGNDPLAATWIPLDMAGGWVAATGILAGLYARAVTGRGQRVATSLLGAGMLLQSGVFVRDGAVVHGPVLDAAQTGYGPGYRIYECNDGNWLALVIPDAGAWTRLRAFPETAELPDAYVPLRGGAHDDAARRAETVLERAFGGAPAATWLARLRAAEVPAVAVAVMTRDRFRAGILDDPVNRQLGRVVAFPTAPWGGFEQIGPLLRCGPDATGGPPLLIPEVGEHSHAVLTELGCTVEEVDALVAAGIVHRPEPVPPVVAE